MKVAAVSWGIRQICCEDDFFGHMAELVGNAANQGANLIVLPELPVLELLFLTPDIAQASIATTLAVYAPRYVEDLERMEAETGALIVGGSHIDATQNVCRFGSARQTKNVLTQWEIAEWGLEPGRGATVWQDVGVNICYDVEFPQASRSLAEAGAMVLCVPSFTETQQGFQRVRWCCLARAVELQVFVVHASLVGNLGREPVPASYGSSAIIAPSVPPFPAGAILAETGFGEEGIAFAEVNLDDLVRCRESGDVRNWQDRAKGDWTVGE